MRSFLLRSEYSGPGLVGIVARVGVLMLPMFLLLGASVRAPGAANLTLWLGAGFQALVCLLSFLSRRTWQQPLGPSIITLHVIALCWLWWGHAGDDWYVNFCKAILLVVPLTLFSYQNLHESGAPAIRRARVLADRLARRREWPADLHACRSLPEVKALRAALSIDASPALALLSHSRLEVRVAALAALEFRKEWKPGQAETILQVGLRAEQPALRAAAVTALASVEERALIERVAEFLHDPSLEVRHAAVEALLWDTERRWSWIRYVVRRVLADPLFQHDGPMWQDGQMLTPEAVNDLTAWAAEKGVLATRSALTLGAYYSRALTERADQALLETIKVLLCSATTSAVLRIELGRVLQYHQELDGRLLQKLLDSANPAPLRLTAVETILGEQTEGELHEAAVAALRDLARLPNREIALATADLIQRRLGVDLGLGLGQPLPPVHSRQAADITRRVMMWAAQNDTEDNMADSRPLTYRGA
jgi:HEAT repeat protein